jgi:peptide/nickel transport system substrate-binding protein
MRGPDAVLANTGVPPYHWAFDQTLGDSLPYDPAQAQALLEAAGWVDRNGDGVRENQDGEPLRIRFLTSSENQEWQDITEVMRSQLAEIGVELRLETMIWEALGDLVQSKEKDFEAFLIAFEVEFRLDERDLFHSDAINGPLAFSGTADDELDLYLDTLQLIPDREEAIPVWHASQRRVLQLQPFTFFYWGNRFDGVNRRLNDATMDARGEWANIRHWWIAPADRTTS